MVPTFVPPKSIEPLGPLSPYIESYASLIRDQGYDPDTIRLQLRVIGRLDQWLQRYGYRIRSLNESLIEQFFRRALKRRWSNPSHPATLRRLLTQLRSIGAIPLGEDAKPKSPAQSVVDDYRRHLLDQQALSEETVRSYDRCVTEFLTYRFGTGPLELSQLRASDVTEYVQRKAAGHGQSMVNILVCGLRSFFRYLRYTGHVDTDLAMVVPKVARWSQSGLPKHLSAVEVKRVLDRCDQETGLGRRNYAIILLLARLGLRGGEVSRLQLEDLDWRNAQITVHGKGQRQDRLPLPEDVGRAIVRYLRSDRPRCSCRSVFIRDHAPRVGFQRAQAIAYIVKTALATAGVKSARKGSHLLRHSLATTMLRNGASLDEIGQLLRHRSPSTTAIYAKVEIDALRPLAMRWPGGAR
jgi:site-specific recombinase XerD